MNDSTHHTPEPAVEGGPERMQAPFDDQGVADGAAPEDLPGAEDLPVDDERALHEREITTVLGVDRPLQDRIH